MRCKSLIPCHCQSSSSRVLPATAASRPRRTMATIPPSKCTIRTSSSACVARSGMLIHSPLLRMRLHDVQLTDELVAEFAGVVPADKGFIDAVRQELLKERHGMVL